VASADDMTPSQIRALILDTNHLSDLARFPSETASVQVLRRLQQGDAALAVSLIQLVEFADPGFKSVGEVRSLLQDVPHVLANPYENVEDEEIAVAVERAGGRTRRPPRVFAADTSEWGDHGGPVGGNAVDMIDAFREMPDVRRALLDMADWGAASSMLKGNAALMKDPLLPLTLAVQHHLDEHRQRSPDYANGLTAAAIIERAGGKAAFPGYQVQEALVAQRLKDPGQKSSANDVFDELIAFYAPYAAVTAIDKRTLHRAKMAKLPSVPRMTRSLSDVPSILDRVIKGELIPIASS
jgi:hypothetical protein